MLTPLIFKAINKIKNIFTWFFIFKNWPIKFIDYFKNNNSKKEDSAGFILWLIFFFACGCIYYCQFSLNFINEIYLFIGLALLAIILFFCNIFEKKSSLYLFILSFLFGSFYSLFYEKFFLNYTKINEKIYVKTIGEVAATKKFYNPVNHKYGLNLLISNPSIRKIEPTESISKKNKKPITKKVKKSKKVKKLKKKNKSKKKIKKITPKFKDLNSSQFKNFINLSNYQEIDRTFLDFQKNYNSYKWITIDNYQQLATPPPFISVNLINFNNNIKINDKIEFFSLLQGPKTKDFADDFDLELDSKLKKISGYGFVIGELKVININNSNNHDKFFNNLRNIINNKILKILPNEEGAIAVALLIGDQSLISKELLSKIRNCGLAHLLSISGFHLSLASVIFFIIFRFLLSHIPFLALRYDLKKISAVFALVACYIYLKISGSPIPAQRAFLMVLLLLLSYFIHEKFNNKRALMLSLFILNLGNPYILFNLSFQLSFIALIMIIYYYQECHKTINRDDYSLEKIKEKKFFINQLFHYFSKIFNYIYEIIIVSTLIQIATLPYLMHSFHNFSLIAPITNIFAIPLTSFVIMPIGFLSLLLMIFNLEHGSLIAMKWGILALEKVIIFFSNFNYSSFSTGHLSLISLAISTFAIFLFFLQHQKSLRILAAIIFIASFFVDKFIEKPALVFADNQKFYTLYKSNLGLSFSKEMRPSKRLNNWLINFNEKKLKIIRNCDKKTGINNYCQICKKNNFVDYCYIYYDKIKALTINSRSKISNLCYAVRKNPVNLIVNLTGKYELPKCFFNNKNKALIIDNFDFLHQKTQLVYIENDKLVRRLANYNN